MSNDRPAIDPTSFWRALKARKLTFFSGVPDSTFQGAYNAMVADQDIRYIPAVREDVALGVASAAYFHGGLGGVMMQNSGIGNIVNPLTSFNLLYRVPALLVVGWRGYGGPPNDAPEHWIMGEKTATSSTSCRCRLRSSSRVSWSSSWTGCSAPSRGYRCLGLCWCGRGCLSDGPIPGHRDNPGTCNG